MVIKATDNGRNPLLSCFQSIGDFRPLQVSTTHYNPQTVTFLSFKWPQRLTHPGDFCVYETSYQI